MGTFVKNHFGFGESKIQSAIGTLEHKHTVGQDVDELICQSERKMQQNAIFYL